jgi:hypothetical protein
MHQVIYTSCRRGRDEPKEGQQIYSYDAGFTESGNHEIRSMFSYGKPAVKGETDEELISKHPQNFAYKQMSDGRALIALGTYLGRDYMGAAGRMGNMLHHVIVCDWGDLQIYPIEMFKGGTFRERMEMSEVNSPDRPEHLPRPIIE